MESVREHKLPEETDEMRSGVMMGYGWGMGVGGWIAMSIFWVSLIVLVVWLATRAFPSGDHRDRDRRDRDSDPRGRPSAEQTLDHRFAAGEIDEAQYRAMLETLRSGRSSHPSER